MTQQKEVLPPDLDPDAVVGVAGESIRTSEAEHRGQIAQSAQDTLDIEGSAADESRAHAEDGVLSAWLFRSGQAPQTVRPADLAGLVDDNANFVWVDLSAYEESDLQALAGSLDLHPASIHAALSPWFPPRLDVFRGRFFVSTTVARLDRSMLRVHASQLDLFVGENYLLSVHKLPLPFADRIMARVYQNPELVRGDSAYMLFIVLDELLEHYEELHSDVQDALEMMEHRALVDTSDEILEDLVNLKRYVYTLGQLAEQHRTVFEAFLRPDFPYLSGEGVDIYYRDLESRLVRLLAALASTRDSVNDAFDIYVSHVSHRTNNVIKVLTLVSTIMMPNWLILSFFSTGFHSVLPGMYSKAGFVAMIVAMLAVTVGVLAAFRRQHWI